MGSVRDQKGTDITSRFVYQTFGSVPASARIEAENLMESLTDIAPRPVIFARLKVHHDEDRTPDQHSVVEATMDVSGEVLRAEAAAATATEAMRIVGNRMERRIQRVAERRQKAEQRPPSTPRGSWRSGDLPTGRPSFYDRPPEERSLVRQKTYSSDQISISEAIFDLEALDYRFFLFTDESDGKPSIVYEDAAGGVAVRKIDGSPPDRANVLLDVRVNETPAPTITVTEAVSRLNMSDMPFVYFQDSDNDLASVLYRRYDGHYGLIVPSNTGL